MEIDLIKRVRSVKNIQLLIFLKCNYFNFNKMYKNYEVQKIKTN